MGPVKHNRNRWVCYQLADRFLQAQSQVVWQFWCLRVSKERPECGRCTLARSHPVASPCPPGHCEAWEPAAEFEESMELVDWFPNRLDLRSMVTKRLYPMRIKEAYRMLKSVSMFNGVVVDARFGFNGHGNGSLVYVGPAAGAP